MHRANNFTGGAVHSFNVFTGTNDFQAWVLYEMSGMTPEEFWLLFFGTRESTEETWFGHNYTGWSWNLDPCDDYCTQNGKFVTMVIVLAAYWNNTKGTSYTIEKLGFFLMMVPFLSPQPVSFADTLGYRHDHEWPLNKDPARIFDAGTHWITGYIKGIPTKEFWQKPLDSIVVGGLGSLLMGCINYCALALLL